METDPPMPRSHEQVVAQQRLQSCQYPGVRSEMQPMAAVVDADASDLEASGVTPDEVVTLDHLDVNTTLRQAQRGSEAGWACTQHDDPGSTHAVVPGSDR